MFHLARAQCSTHGQNFAQDHFTKSKSIGLRQTTAHPKNLDQNASVPTKRPLGQLHPLDLIRFPDVVIHKNHHLGLNRVGVANENHRRGVDGKIHVRCGVGAVQDLIGHCDVSIEATRP